MDEDDPDRRVAAAPLSDADIRQSARIYLEGLGLAAAIARVRRLADAAEARGNRLGADNHRRVLALLETLGAAGAGATRVH